MGNRRNGQSWARTEFGGMPVWGLAVAAFVMAVIAVLTLTNLPRASEATGPSALPSSSLLVDLDRPIVAFIGDSYTAGDVLSESERTAYRWPSVMSRALDVRSVNFGVGGSGYTVAGPFQNASTYEERIPQINRDADVIIVSGGRNDQDPGRYEQAVNSFFPALRSAFPNAQIIAVEPFWDSSEYPERLDRLGALVRTSVEGVGGRYIDGPGDALIGHPEWILEDGVHPNVQGHAELARVVGEGIGTITVTQPTEPVAATWIGDSFTEGSQVDESQRFATLVSAHFGWKATNQAEGGTGYVADGPDNFPDRGPFTEHVARTVAAKPGVVIVAGGMNDQDLDLSDNEIRDAVEETLRGLREGLPDAKIYVIGPFWNNGYPTPAVEREREVVQDVAASLSIPFIDPIGGEWITGTNDGREKGNRVDYIGQDGTHPNVAGQAWIAQKIIAALTDAGATPRVSE